MPAFNTFTKAASLKGGLGNGSTRDKLRNLSGHLNSAASILDDFITAPPGSGIAATKSSVVNPKTSILQGGVFKFPEDLGTTEYPSWVEITIYTRKTLGADIADAFNSEEDIINAASNGIGAGVKYKRSKDRLDEEGTVSVPIAIVCLPIQAGMGTDDKGVSVGAEELGSVGGAILEQGLGGALDSALSTDFLKGLGTAIAFKTPGVGKALKLMTGSVENPYSYQMFNGVQHRGFNLTFNVAPLSAADSTMFLTIKELLSYHMMPENNGFLLTVPDEFKIRYMHLVKNADGTYSQEENKFYPKSMGCYLTQVGYIPNDQGDVIHADGAPMTSQLQLQFAEIEVLDKDRMRQGNYYYQPQNNSAKDERGGDQ